MGYYFKGDYRGYSGDDAYQALAKAGFYREVKSLGELKKRLASVELDLPIGTKVKISRVYRMVRGYEPDKPRSGSVDQETVYRLDAHGSFYNPKTGKPKPAKWTKEP